MLFFFSKNLSVSETVLTLTDPVAVVIVTKGAFRSTKTREQQNTVGRAGSTGERPRPTAGVT